MDTKQLVRSYFEDWNYGRLRHEDPRWAGLAEICTPDYTMHRYYPGGYEERVGLEVFRGAVASILRTWSEMSFEIHDLIGEENRVAVRFVIHGTLAGAFRGIEAPGARVSFAGNNVIDVREGRIAGEWIYEDFLSVIEQIGGTIVPGGNAHA